MEQSFGCAFGDGDSHNTSFRLWREECGKRSYLIEKGVEPLLIRDRLGHKDIRITLNTYGHLYPNQQRKIANLLDNENGNAVTGLGEERDEC